MFALVVFAIIMFQTKPLITSPYTVYPMDYARYGGLDDPGYVFVQGVLKGKNIYYREDVTHKINIDELVAIIANENINRNRLRGRFQTRNESWEIRLYQNRHMHIRLRGEFDIGDTVVVGRSTYAISGGNAIIAALERMIEEYNKI